MHRLLAIGGLGVALTCFAAPASAQVQVVVGVATARVAGQVVFGSPPGHPVPPSQGYGYPTDDWEYSRDRAEHAREMHRQRAEAEREYWKDVREAEREYWKDVREWERERAKAAREYEREYRKEMQEAARETQKRRLERERWKR